jgi:hypothetical protein
MFRLNLRDGILVGLGVKPLRAVKTTGAIEAGLSIVLF